MPFFPAPHGTKRKQAEDRARAMRQAGGVAPAAGSVAGGVIGAGIGAAAGGLPSKGIGALPGAAAGAGIGAPLGGAAGTAAGFILNEMADAQTKELEESDALKAEKLAALDRILGRYMR